MGMVAAVHTGIPHIHNVHIRFGREGRPEWNLDDFGGWKCSTFMTED